MMGVGAAQNAAGSGGMGTVSARIAEIQSRIEALTGPRVGTAPVIGGVGTGSAAASTTFDQELSSAVATASRTATPTTTSTSATSGSRATASTGADPGTAAAELAAKLPSHGRAWAPAITEAALKVGIEPALLAALVQHESNFDPDAVSHAGALGLAQLMPATAAGLGVNPKDPHQNLAGGARFLKEQLDRFGAVDLALAAYNAGPTRVARAGGVPRIAETTAYVSRVTATWEKLR